MIPKFPKFKKLEIQDKKEIENYVKSFAPYSDFNFTSLWTYNTEETIEISYLNNNLVVKFLDYIDKKHFYSFIGTKKILETIKILIKQAKKNKIDHSLKLIPQEVIDAEKRIKDFYLLKEDKDNYDYIVSASEIAKLDPIKFKRKRYLVDRFKRKYPDYKIKILDLRNEKVQKQIKDLFLAWEKQVKRSREETENELKAINRLLDHLKYLDIYGTGIYLNNKLVAFNTYELTHNKYGISSFQKADKSLTGIYAILTHEAAKHLHKLGCEFINFEQDLGIEGLRLSKSLWKPKHYLKKYIITEK
jgi:uncharacterized protein